MREITITFLFPQPATNHLSLSEREKKQYKQYKLHQVPFIRQDSPPPPHIYKAPLLFFSVLVRS